MVNKVIDSLVTLYRLIKRFEGCKLIPYLCPAGIWTCGWGSTGFDVFPGRSWTQEYADARMNADALKFAKAVLKGCPGLKGDQLCAIADFAYNCGIGNFMASTLRRKINAGQYAEVPEQLMRWTKGAGKVLPGLVIRRRVEADFFRWL